MSGGAGRSVDKAGGPSSTLGVTKKPHHIVEC